MANPIEIFKAGTHTSSDGQRLTFSEGDIARCAAAYDPDLSDAPLVVGHPQTDAPAYGWVDRLRADGGVLKASTRQVDPAFSEMVNAGRFRRVSAAFFMPNAPNNPKPGTVYLRHVGFLGAQPPAVKRLKAASFSANSAAVLQGGDPPEFVFVDALDVAVAAGAKIDVLLRR